MTKASEVTPRTAAGRAFYKDPPNTDEEALMGILAIEAEAGVAAAAGLDTAEPKRLLRALAREGLLPWEQFGPNNRDVRLRQAYRDALNAARAYLAERDAQKETA
jgi:hypothetical protein